VMAPVAASSMRIRDLGRTLSGGLSSVAINTVVPSRESRAVIGSPTSASRENRASEPSALEKSP
jgi:hypothetical protein